MTGAAIAVSGIGSLLQAICLITMMVMTNRRLQATEDLVLLLAQTLTINLPRRGMASEEDKPV